MLELEDIKKEVWSIACKMLETGDNEPINNSLLHVILSESQQALEFVCLLEDEFDIEFDDDDIDLDFFSNFDDIAKKLLIHTNGSASKTQI